MNNRLLAVTFAVLLLILVAIIGGYVANCGTQIKEILQSPAATTNITIEELTIISPAHEYEIKVKNFSGQMNSKVLDLILMAVTE